MNFIAPLRRWTVFYLPRAKPEYVAFGSGHLALVAASFVFNVVAAGLLGPARMGIWQSALLISTYGIVITLGIVNGLGREIPVHRGRDDATTVTEVVSTTVWGVLGPVLLIAAIAIAAGFSSVENRDVILIGLVVLAGRAVNTFSRILLRSFQSFRLLGGHQALTAAVFILGIPVLLVSPTLASMTFIMVLATVGPGLLARPYISLRSFSFARWVSLVRVGLPIMLVGVAFTLMHTVDRLVVLGALGVNRLGVYTPALTVFGALFVLPGIVSNIVYPHMARLYGEQVSIRALGQPVRTLLVVNYAVTIPVALMLGALFHILVIPTFLPEYLDSRAPMLLLLGTALFLPLGASFGDFFNVVGAQKLYMRNTLIGAVTNLILSVFFVNYLYWDLSGVAAGTLGGVALYAGLQWAGFRRMWQHAS